MPWIPPSLGPWIAGSGDGGHRDTDMAASCESSKVVGWIPNVGCSALHDDIFTKHVEDDFLIPHQNAGSSLPNAVLRDFSSSGAGTSQPAPNTVLAPDFPPVPPPFATYDLSMGGSAVQSAQMGKLGRLSSTTGSAKS